MNKRDLKKVVLAQLANMLRNESIVDGVEYNEEDMARMFDVQEELAKEFEARGAGAKYDESWTCQ